jgi:hypothetical protein
MVKEPVAHVLRVCVKRIIAWGVDNFPLAVADNGARVEQDGAITIEKGWHRPQPGIDNDTKFT